MHSLHFNEQKDCFHYKTNCSSHYTTDQRFLFIPLHDHFSKKIACCKSKKHQSYKTKPKSDDKSVFLFPFEISFIALPRIIVLSHPFNHGVVLLFLNFSFHVFYHSIMFFLQGILFFLSHPVFLFLFCLLEINIHLFLMT